jgi:hypothetical protein
VPKSIGPVKNGEASTLSKQEPFQIGEEPKAAGYCHRCGTPLLCSDNYCTACGTPRREKSFEQATPAESAATSGVRAFGGKSGPILEEMDNPQEAFSEYRTAARLNPADKAARGNLAIALEEGAKPAASTRKDKNAGQVGEATKAVKVVTKYFRSFNMPPYCVMCGNTPSQGTITAERLKSGWSGAPAEILKLGFPLCQECHEVWEKKSSCSERLVGWIANLVILGVGLLTVGFVTSGDSQLAVFGLVLGVPLILAIILFLRRWSKRGWTPAQSERRRRLVDCVKILGFQAPGLLDKSGYILFQFRNPLFAEEFSARNDGKMR